MSIHPALPRRQQITRWGAVLLWAGIIFYLSSLPRTAFPVHTTTAAKIVHAVEYAVLTVLLIGALEATNIRRRRAALIAAVLALVYAASDEYHQSFVPYRHPSPIDVLIDAIGIGAVALVSQLRNSPEAAPSP
jgi:VanZ family protein